MNVLDANSHVERMKKKQFELNGTATLVVYKTHRPE